MRFFPSLCVLIKEAKEFYFRLLGFHFGSQNAYVEEVFRKLMRRWSGDLIVSMSIFCIILRKIYGDFIVLMNLFSRRGER
jgi:hypothetical protein